MESIVAKLDAALYPAVCSVNTYLSNYILVFLLVAVGLWYSIKTRFVQVRCFGEGMRRVFGNLTLNGKKHDSGMSSFQALATAIAAQVGTGNIVGASGAILTGGPGAIFWMWVIAFFGMATIYAEATLAIKTRVKAADGTIHGGPVYYITTAFKGGFGKFLATFFAVAIILALGFMGCMVQSNSIADAFKTAFDVPPLVMGLIIAACGAFVFFGGIGRIAAVTEKMVPLMALLYVIGGLFVVLSNADQIIPAFKMIFVGAFDPSAATGGIIGAGVKEAIRYGVARGLFSNEAGMGSTPHAHAVAKVQYPAQQGLMGIVSVFIDTFVVLNMTALVIFVTGALDGTTTGIALTQKAFSTGLGAFGIKFVAICLLFFAFSTIVGWYFFGEQNVKYLFGTRGVTPYRMVVMCFIVMGSLLQVNLVWELADMFNGLMAFPNLIALIGLAKVVSKALDEFEQANLADNK